MAENHGEQWYAVRVRSRHESVVQMHLRARGLEPFLPSYRQQHRWSDRLKAVDLPLFPGYVFCRFDLQNRLPVLSVPGVVHVVGAGKIPIPIDNSEIAAIQVAVRSGLHREPWPYLAIGNKVRIECGPLQGVEGILEGFKGQRRIILSITLLQRSVSVQVEGDSVRPVAPQQPLCSKAAASQARSLRPIV